MHSFFTLHWLKGSLSRENSTTDKMLSSGKMWWSDTNRTIAPVVSCGQDSRTLNTYPGEHCHPSMCNHTSCLHFQLDSIESSGTTTSAFPPQQGTDTTNCPKEPGLCRFFHCFPLSAFPYCESYECLCKVLRFLHCYGNTVLCSYWNIQVHLHTTPGFADDSQIPEQTKVFKSQCGISI